MGAAPLLIMLAAVGVDYGWQPDGTTSPRGDNVQYIIQISPDQIKSIGEITSTIDPEIQGRISRVVVRVGTAKLPRDAGRAVTVAAVSQAAALGDDAQLPIPEISDTAIAQAQNAPAQNDRADWPGSEAVMKPDPQSGGFALPDSQASPVRTNPAVSTDPAAKRDNQWNDIRGQSSAIVAGTNAATAGTSAGGPSTDPIDPATRSTAWPTTPGQSGMTGTTGSTGLGTAAAVPNSTFNPVTTPTATSGTRRATDPSDPNWSGYGTTPNFGTLPPGLNTNQTGAGANSAAIGYPQTMPTAADLSRQASDLQRNAAGQIDSAAGVSQTFARDAAGNLLDRLGRPIDSLGRLIDPETGNLVDASGNWIDQYGRKIDRFGRPLPSESTTAAQGDVASLQAPPLASQRNDGGFYGQTTSGFSQVGQNTTQNQAWNPSLAQNGLQGGFQTGTQSTSLPQGPSLPQGQGAMLNQSRLNQQQLANQQFANQQQGFGQNGFPATSNATDPRLLRQNELDYARASVGFEEDNLRSASDSRLALNSRAASDARAAELELARQTAIARQAATAPTKPRGVAAQPFFNFMLLISVVGNAYLIFETSNLRRKFRNMIANVRATKISAQPAG
jgi:hypothetical protein